MITTKRKYREINSRDIIYAGPIEVSDAINEPAPDRSTPTGDGHISLDDSHMGITDANIPVEDTDMGGNWAERPLEDAHMGEEHIETPVEETHMGGEHMDTPVEDTTTTSVEDTYLTGDSTYHVGEDSNAPAIGVAMIRDKYMIGSNNPGKGSFIPGGSHVAGETTSLLRGSVSKEKATCVPEEGSYFTGGQGVSPENLSRGSKGDYPVSIRAGTRKGDYHIRESSTVAFR